MTGRMMDVKLYKDVTFTADMNYNLKHALGGGGILLLGVERKVEFS
jgi:hypothetical protein